MGRVTHQHIPGATLGDGAGFVEARIAVGPTMTCLFNWLWEKVAVGSS
jgi:hypothetical protein